MAQRTVFSAKMAFLPEGARDFLKRRAIEFGGVAVLLLAAVLAMALLTYNPLDPSFNNATTAPITNAVGRIGAFVADVILQTLGIAGAALVLVLAAWAARIMSHRGLRWPHVALLPAALVLFAAAAAALPESSGGTLPAGAFQSPNTAFNCGMILSSVVSPATRIFTLSGRM